MKWFFFNYDGVFEEFLDLLDFIIIDVVFEEYRVVKFGFDRCYECGDYLVVFLELIIDLFGVDMVGLLDLFVNIIKKIDVFGLLDLGVGVMVECLVCEK